MMNNLDVSLPLLQEQRRRSQETGFLISTRFPNLELRLRKERQLLFLQWRALVGCCLFLNYFVLVVFRNLAYFRTNPGMRPLKDIGHQALPEMQENPYAEGPMFVTFGLMIFSALGAFAGHDDPRLATLAGKKPYFVNSLKRLMLMFAVGHFLRALTYLSTNLPGPAHHCQNPALYDPPPTLWSCFYHLVSSNGNCGDLNFSGHIFLSHLGTMYVSSYGRKFWGLAKYGRPHLLMTGTCLLVSVVQSMFILAMRHHYSVDVMLACYVAPLLWSFMDEYMVDMEPDLGVMESELVVESTWPLWLRIAYFVFTLVLLAAILVSLAFSLGGNYRFVGFA